MKTTSSCIEIPIRWTEAVRDNLPIKVINSNDSLPVKKSVMKPPPAESPAKLPLRLAA